MTTRRRRVTVEAEMASRLILRRGRSLVASALSGARHARLVAPAQSSAPAAALRLASSSAGGEHSHVEPRTHEEQTEWVKKELGEVRKLKTKFLL